MRYWILGLVGVAVLALGLGVGVWLSQPGGEVEPNSPEAVVLKGIGCGTAQPLRDFEVVEKREVVDGTLVLFTASCFAYDPDKLWDPIYGYSIVRWEPTLGRLVAATNWSRGTDWDDGRLVEWTPGQQLDENGRRTVTVMGRALAEEVAAVEVVFDSGETMREPVKQGVFVLFGGGEQGVRSVRALDADGNILEERK